MKINPLTLLKTTRIRNLASLAAAIGLFAAPVYTGIASATTTNVVTNSSFESPSNMTGWTGAPNIAVVDGTTAHSGTQSAKVTLAFAGSQDVLNDSPSWLLSGNTYDAVYGSAWVKGPAGRTVRLTLYPLKNQDAPHTTTYTLPDSNWHQVVTQPVPLAQSGNASASEVDYKLGVTNGQIGDVYNFDEITENGVTESVKCGVKQPVSGALPWSSTGDSIENCSAEESSYGLLYWNNAPDGVNSTLSVDGTTAHSGTSSFKLLSNAAGTITLNDSSDSRSGSAIPAAATTCTATAWVKTSAPTHGAMKLRLREYAQVGGAQLSTNTASFTATDTNWHQISVTDTLSAGHAASTLDLNAYQVTTQAGDVLNIDDIHETCL